MKGTNEKRRRAVEKSELFESKAGCMQVLAEREEKHRLDVFKQRVCAKISRSCNRKGFRKKKRKEEENKTNEKGVDPKGV
jgi:hypothetical protein